MSNTSSSNGVGFFGLLALLLIGLKLAEVITWSWGWILSPLWLPIAFIIFVIVFWNIVALMMTSKKET